MFSRNLAVKGKRETRLESAHWELFSWLWSGWEEWEGSGGEEMIDMCSVCRRETGVRFLLGGGDLIPRAGGMMEPGWFLCWEKEDGCRNGTRGTGPRDSPLWLCFLCQVGGETGSLEEGPAESGEPGSGDGCKSSFWHMTF